ncbi:phosphoglucosamine mutase [Nocardioides sp. R-C-SC26]|uniref:phosphoglucosamine mutase n=1 Tax=Nocardioides sp. R-C-SC26 TaxID=2870414 RepID=UPI001E3DD0B8|nr:phosphoglucosamine mutase [Nocardioides sp. R-C-SC26]
MTRIFGTDGVRGLANGVLTAELALDLSVAAARVMVDGGEWRGRNDKDDATRPRVRPLAVVGRDPRISGQFLEHAVVAGLTSAGVDVLRLRVLPTPGVAYLTAALGADLGVVISASHNPMPDNGIKFLQRGGHKLDDAVEEAVEAVLGQEWERPTGGDIGRVEPYGKAVEEYVEHLLGTLAAPRPLAGLRIVLDCAHGAAYQAGPMVLRAAGADVIAIGVDPDGLNINDGCGSTHLGPLRDAVLAHGADAGIALDGDADRCLAVDHEGHDIDGDQILAVLALALAERDHLPQRTVVSTVMSNLGFVQAMSAAGIAVEQTKVGDRYVLESMRAGGFALGGEQSGHVIMSEHATTGDGLLTALHLLARMASTGSTLQQLAAVVTRLPQVLVNVPDVDKTRAETDSELAAAVAAEEAALAGNGRILLRPSGTEALVRVMVEAPSQAQADDVAHRLAVVVKERLGR